MPIRVLKKDKRDPMISVIDKKDKKEKFIKKSQLMKNKDGYTPADKGSSKLDIFKSYGKYDGKPMELKSGGLTGGRKKLDKNKDGKITGEDFKMMKQGYGAARKDGMGLQDESIKPGKVMKASKGGGADTGRMGEIKSKLALAKDKFKRMEPGGRPSKIDFKRIIDLMKSKEPKKMQPLAKKMGGGMMQKYQTGGSVMARGCKLGRKKATKLY